MKQPSLYKLRGAVRITVTGGDIEGLINLLAVQGLEVWNLRARDGRRADMNILLPDFFKLRPLLKRTGCKVKVTHRRGFPFFVARLLKRKFFLGGMLFFIAALFALTSMVWNVEVKGNVKIPTDEILAAAQKEGLYPFQWSFRLPSQDKLSRQLALTLPDVTWVGVTKEGTNVTIQVVESAQPKREPLMNPRHLISKSDAVVTQIYAEQGRPVVQENMRVKKGQVLISGILGDEENTENVVAKGDIRGLVWREYQVEVPLIQKLNTMTGESKERFYIVLGKWAVQLWGYGKVPFNSYETSSNHDPLTWRSFSLPMGWLTETDRETRAHEVQQSVEWAKSKGLEGARNDIIAKNGKETKIISEKILHEKKENGKVYMKVLFEVEESIAEELPLVHSQGE
ncbi:sporulation protein [Paenibacillus sp. Root52]|uniref:sporulation protein YqfD n=1 Tax=Paenibacillus sp. Root52 TaxID=1736552 RepID=UPI0006F5C35B|nr:sporulation protein YqfD [Paenibacillus sp. Root52]KQY87409.1 sporulation protein [Paenibacillus sp. Root52]